MRCRYWLLKIRALAEAGFWQVLEAFAGEKKSPVGYRPFVEACLKYGTAEQARPFLPKVGEGAGWDVDWRCQGATDDEHAVSSLRHCVAGCDEAA